MSGFGLISNVLWKAFYRRHAFPLGLIVFLVAGIMEPPHLLFTGLFIRSLLLNPLASWTAVFIGVGMGTYAAFFLFRCLGKPIMEFLVVCGSLPVWRLFLISWWNIFMAGFLGWLYLLLMGYHAFTLGIDLAWEVSLLVVVLQGALAFVLASRLSGRWFWQGWDWQIPMMNVGLAGFFWKQSLRINRLTWLMVKGFSFSVTVALSQFGEAGVLIQIVWLALCCMALLHMVLVFNLRQDELIFLPWLSSLPVSGLRVWCSYMLVQLAWILPEGFVLALGKEVPFEWFMMFLVVSIPTQALALGLTYLPEMTGRDYMRMAFGVFLMVFTGLIFSFPLWILFGLLFLGGLISFGLGFKTSFNRLDTPE